MSDNNKQQEMKNLGEWKIDNRTLGRYPAFPPSPAFDYEKIEEFFKSTGILRKGTAISPEELKKTISDKCEKLKKEMEMYEKALHYLENAPFKQGDCGYTKEYGNVLIKEIFFDTTDVKNPIVKYTVATIHGDREVEINKILPLNDATKVLYSK